MLGPAPTRLVLEVALDASRVRERLRASIDAVSSVLLSPTWGLRRAVVGRVDDQSFALRVRHGYSNGLTRIAYGRLTPVATGTRVDVEFRTLRFVVAILRAAWIAIALLAAPVAQEVWRHGPRPLGLVWALLAPAALLALLIGIEALARRMGRGDEQSLRRHLESLFEGAARRG